MAARFIIILTIYTGLQVYIGWNLDLFISENGGQVHAAVFWPLFALVAFSYLFAMLLRKFLPKPATTLLKWIGSYWIALMQYSVLLLPVADLAAWGLRSASMTRADSIVAAGWAAIVALILILVRGSRNAWSPVVREYEVTIPKSAGSLKQLRLAVASDLHLGMTVGRKHLQRLVDGVNALKPDLVLLPGDVLDDAVEPFIRNHYAQQLAQIKSRYGTFAVLGNHEYYGGGIDTYVQAMKEVGIPVMLDDHILIADSFHLIGRKDKTDHARKNVAALVSELDMKLPIILMDHQPSAIREIAEGGVDLSLHGHTHRGQMAPNHFVTRRIFELDYGYKLIAERLHAFVSSGFGTWGPPIRLGSRSEIWSITVNFTPPGK
ncbi:metallophosphoesterase [Paenibacillus albus]|uniref:Metallophosphoesterase n=1 Tax=Paenibacillus albus TaxID=2495582 RepID=A0A3S9A9J2_9BACL|nr:metallophosphoesterase [Paenibacillus albus]AZN42361.1 metallophosphoesterase [Paenibacillus albus]